MGTSRTTVSYTWVRYIYYLVSGQIAFIDKNLSISGLVHFKPLLLKCGLFIFRSWGNDDWNQLTTVSYTWLEYIYFLVSTGAILKSGK